MDDTFPDNTFLLNPNHTRILDGESRLVEVIGTAERRNEGPIAAVAIVLVASLIVFLLTEPTPQQAFAVLIGLGVVSALAVFAFGGLNAQKAARLQARGQLVRGEVVKAEGRHRVDRDHGVYVLCLTYRFALHGKTLTGYAERIRDDLRDETLPEAGTPVAVMVSSKRLYRVL
ncbi:MAG: hypothetical protein GYB64_15590 [Chloroflexi bacterium]|nr:hypothetical protein [Chloroflexota bacterium]